MIFVHELLVYVPLFLECFLLAYLMLKAKPVKNNYLIKLVSVVSAGIVWQLPICALIYLDFGPLNDINAIIKFTLSSLPLILLLLCYRVRSLNILFVILLSFIFQHWSSVFAEIIVEFTSVSDNFFICRAVSWLCYALMLIALWFFISEFNSSEELCDDIVTLLLFMFSFGFFEVCTMYIKNGFEVGIWKIIIAVIELAFGILMLRLSIYVTIRNRKKSEHMVSDALLEKERRQFEMLKRNTENMQAQLHDLKYILRAFKSQNRDEAVFEKLENLVSDYESAYNTGNPVLDVILCDAEKTMAQNGIRFECLAQCSNSFMENFDLYSLLGNAFDNACEYLKNIEKEKRYVSCIIKKSGTGFVFIEISNYYEGDGNVYVGMETSKKDKEAHGYGVKNMQKIVEKYGGSFSVKAEDGAFFVTALVPLTLTK